ncbi:BpFREP22.2 [Biomphalaria pfeifferi]|uniref:BpFREP22.2 n=1 Tax=Biomphalaria pfeifferi TaxID=112525 RepID=A0AAD8C2S6_BIOPF|nr:BpFREP22.2 [Biomphalaria pfeifferi]
MAVFLHLAVWATLVSLSTSELLIDVQPNVILEELTPKLVINCSISNNQVQQIDMIRSLSLARYNENIKEFEIMVYLEAATLNLTQYVQFQRSQIGFGNMYIILTFQEPTQSDARVYRCNVTGDDASGINISLVNKKEVKYETLSKPLLDEIRRLKKDADKNQCSSIKEEITDKKKQRSKLSFVGSSEVINEFIDPLTLTCSFQDLNLHPNKNYTVEFMYIFHETNGVIATISKGQTVVTALQEVGSNNVKGELSDEKLQESYLHVTWRNVRSSDSGKYFCGAHVIGSDGRAERLNEIVTVKVKLPTFEDLVNVIQKLLIQVNDDREILHDNTQNIKSIQNELSNNQDNVIKIYKDLDNHEQNFIRIKIDLDSNQQNIKNINQDLDNQKQNIIRINTDLDSKEQQFTRFNTDLDSKQQTIISIKQDLESSKKDFNEHRQNISIFKDMLDTVILNRSSSLADVKEELTKVNKKLQESCKCLPKPTSCRHIVSTKDRVVVTLASGLEVMCDTKTDGGGWTIFQRRLNGKVDFYRGWKEYRDGFGDDSIGEFYLGNENIFNLTSTGQYDLRIDLEFNNTKYFAQYKDFKILSETEKYKLKIGNYSGNAGDDLSYHNNMYFSTFDRDNDVRDINCAERRSGAWWYNSCHSSNLNGQWGGTSDSKGMNWEKLTGYSKSVIFSEMKIREREKNYFH